MSARDAAAAMSLVSSTSVDSTQPFLSRDMEMSLAEVPQAAQNKLPISASGLDPSSRDWARIQTPAEAQGVFGSWCLLPVAEMPVLI